jgi:hypothetical protein
LFPAAAPVAAYVCNVNFMIAYDGFDDCCREIPIAETYQSNEELPIATPNFFRERGH